MTTSPETLHRVNKIENNEFPENTLRIAMGFLHQKYPLTEAGLALQSQIRDLIAADDFDGLKQLEEELPTVENPHPELFGELLLDDDRKVDLFAVGELGRILVSKGCYHNCAHCFLDSNPRVKVMPFAAVLKIGESVKKVEADGVALIPDWLGELKELIGEEFPDYREALYKFKYHLIGQTEFVNHCELVWKILCNKFGSAEKAAKGVLAMYLEHPISKYFPPPDDYLEDPDFNDADYGDYTMYFFNDDFPKLRNRHVIHYFDSEVFNYRDPNFRHQDGTSADYADVFMALSSELRPTHITTAGWFLNDTVAQRAAQKLVGHLSSNSQELTSISISVSPYERVARQDFDRYLEMMRNVILTLTPLRPKIYFEVDSRMDPKVDEEYREKVLDPLREMIDEINEEILEGQSWGKLNIYENMQISYFSGRMQDDDYQSDHDVGGRIDSEIISPVIINYDGSVSLDNYKQKGDLPEETGIKIY